MSDRCCGPEPADIEPNTRFLTRRRVLTAGAVTGAAVAFGGLPALGQTNTASSGEGDDSTTTDSTTTTSTAPPRGPVVAEPVHPDDDPVPEALDGFDTLLPESPNRNIMFPVFPNSATTWTRNQDTYGACRSGCSRRHQGEDLLAPQMTKLLACVSGTIVEFRHRSSGNSLYIRGDDGWFYAYLHINDEVPGTHNPTNEARYAWAPALRRYVGNEAAARGHRVQKGEFIAYVGDSGNAGTTHQLHFEIRKPASGTFSSETQRLWNSASVNPRESLRNASPARERASVPPETFQPWTTSEAFITYQYRDFLGRNPSSADMAYYKDLLDYGTRSPDWLMELFLTSAECDSKTQSVARLYQAFYKRMPDTDGFLYWLEKRRGPGWSINRVAEQFSRAPEFTTMYGTLTNREYVELVYRNVLNRTASSADIEYWQGELDAGRYGRGRMMTLVSESPENKTARKNSMHVIAAYGVMLNRMPTASEHSTWKGILDSGATPRDMIVMLRMSDEYQAAVAAA